MGQRFLGIDPGFGRVGYAIVHKDSKNNIVCEAYGCLSTEPGKSFEKRLHEIYKDLTDIIQEYQPDVMCIEELFFAKNVTTGLQVAHARGIIMLTAEQNNLEISEFKPVQVKQAVAGVGSAKKRQIQEMVKILFKLDQIPQPDDAADALAVAWCGATSYSITKLKKSL